MQRARLVAASPSSALADDPVRELEQGFEVCVAPRPTQGLGIFVLSSQVPALIAYVRYELMEMTTETESG